MNNILKISHFLIIQHSILIVYSNTANEADHITSHKLRHHTPIWKIKNVIDLPVEYLSYNTERKTQGMKAPDPEKKRKKK